MMAISSCWSLEGLGKERGEGVGDVEVEASGWGRGKRMNDPYMTLSVIWGHLSV